MTVNEVPEQPSCKFPWEIKCLINIHTARAVVTRIFNLQLRIGIRACGI